MTIDVCVIGGGTAANFAVAHCLQHHPNVSVTQIYPSDLPSIRIGESTTPIVRTWLGGIGFSYQRLATAGLATEKLGLKFDGWGVATDSFSHLFLPGNSAALHISATQTADFLIANKSFERIDDYVASKAEIGGKVILKMRSSLTREFDFVIHATGFPDTLEGVLQFPDVPNNRALLLRTDQDDDTQFTLCKAARHGWIFSIPLHGETSFGYIHNTSFAKDEELKSELEQLALGSGAIPVEPMRRLSFPSFCRERFVHGREAWIGNCASFLEPLEATAIGVSIWQLEKISSVLSNQDFATSSRRQEELNQQFRSLVTSIYYFLLLHYSMGSKHQTPYWRSTSSTFWRIMLTEKRDLAAQNLPDFLRASTELNAEVIQRMRCGSADRDDIAEISALGSFGGFNAASFRQIVDGLGLSEELRLQRVIQVSPN